MVEKFNKDIYLNKINPDVELQMLYGIEIPEKDKNNYKNNNLNETKETGQIVPKKIKKKINKEKTDYGMDKSGNL
jgi:hypothetical protein